jgi:hypothetical protein
MSLEQTEVYVLVHEEAGAVKVGISRQHFARGHSRVRAHECRGWRLHRSLTLRTARLAYDIEQAVIDRLRLDLYAPPADVDMPQYGRTETAPAALVPPDLLWDLVCGEAERLITETPADHRDRPPRPARGRSNWGMPKSVEDVRFGRLVRELPEGARSTERHRSARSRVADQQREAAYSVWGEHYTPYGIWDGDSATIAGRATPRRTSATTCRELPRRPESVRRTRRGWRTAAPCPERARTARSGRSTTGERPGARC